MVKKGDIARSLDRLDSKYNAALTSPDPGDPIDYSRLAVIIYCGWLEESMDKIAKRSILHKPTTTAFKDMAAGKIDSNHGFQYKDNFRKMMIPLIGISNMEKLELNMNLSGRLLILNTELQGIRGHRNNAAHTFEAADHTYPAPSLLKSKVDALYPIFREIFSFVVHLR